MNSIYTRRSVRTYTEAPVSENEIIQIIKAGMQAPSSCNQQHWEFLVVTNRDTLIELSKVSNHSQMLVSAAFAVVVLANFDEMPHTYDSWQQDLGACTQNMLLQAAELDLGAVWVGVAPDSKKIDFISKLFDLSMDLTPFAIVSGGHPLHENANIYIDRFEETKIHFEKY